MLIRSFFLTTALAFSAEDDWSRWRGPNNDGMARGDVPLEWSETKNVVWKVKMPGKAGATPVIWGDRLFVSSGDGKDNVLLCLDTDGKTLWKRKIGAAGRFDRARGLESGDGRSGARPLHP